MPPRRLVSKKLSLGLATLLLTLGGCVETPSNRGVPEEALRHNIVGNAYLGQQKWAEAEAEFRQALAIRPEDPLLLNNAAIALVQAGSVEQAEELLQRALTHDADSPYVHFNLGLIHKSRGEFEEATSHFEAVHARDPDDLLTEYNLGIVYSRIERLADSEAALRRALEHDPSHVSSLYALGRSLLQRGDAEEGARLISESQRIRARSGLDEAVGSQYGEQGPYAMGVDYPGDALAAPPEIPIRLESSLSIEGGFPPGAVSVRTRWGADRSTAWIVARGRSVERLTPDEGLRAIAPELPGGSIVALASGDLDNDGTVELVALIEEERVVRPFGLRLGEDGVGMDWSREPISDPATLDEALIAADVLLVDRDHDGDLDLFWCWSTASDSTCRLDTNPGSGSFVRTAGDQPAIVLEQPGAAWLQLELCDADNDRDVDLFVGTPSGATLFSNERGGTFADVSESVGLTREGGLAALTVVDLNKDGFMDLLLAGEHGLQLAANRRGSFEPPRTLAGRSEPVGGVLVVDVDNDGFFDLATSDTQGGQSRIYRNLGDGEWQLRDDWLAGAHRAIDAVDLDGDGDLDLIAGNGSGTLELLRNEGGDAHHWIQVDPGGVGDNRDGIGTKVEILAGSLRQKAEVTRPAPLHFGLGPRAAVETVRFLWPSGVLQDEIRLDGDRIASIEQLDRKGTSCPLLYAWADGRWSFVTDFLGGCAIGYQQAHGLYGMPDTDEYVKIESGLAPDDEGRVKLRLNNQLQEVLWFDQAELVVVDHPEGTELFPNERLMPGPPWTEFELFVSDRVEPVVAARSIPGGRDLSAVVARADRSYVEDFDLLPFKGYADFHAIELDLGSFPEDQRIVLLLDGWIDYADSSANVAAQQAGHRLIPPLLMVADGRGGFQEADLRVGFPAGLPKTMAVELTGVFPSADHRVRIGTNMRIYWDRIRVLRGGEQTETRVTRLAPTTAELRFGGFPEETSPDGKPPYAYDPYSVAATSPWQSHAGGYTAFGEVASLLSAIDDRFVTTRPGDEIELRFAVPEQPPAGWTRTYLLYADGFGKDMDANSAANATVAPIPFHGMPSYPYPAELSPPARSLPERAARRVLDSPFGWPGARPLELAAAGDDASP